MDTGEGRFVASRTPDLLNEMRSQYPKAKGIFEVGEEIEIRGSLFKVKDISPMGIKLWLLPAKD
jgi:hypothetical protein